MTRIVLLSLVYLLGIPGGCDGRFPDTEAPVLQDVIDTVLEHYGHGTPSGASLTMVGRSPLLNPTPEEEIGFILERIDLCSLPADRNIVYAPDNRRGDNQIIVFNSDDVRFPAPDCTVENILAASTEIDPEDVETFLVGYDRDISIFPERDPDLQPLFDWRRWGGFEMELEVGLNQLGEASFVTVLVHYENTRLNRFVWSFAGNGYEHLPTLGEIIAFYVVPLDFVSMR